MLITQSILQEFLAESKADSVIVFDSLGNVILAENLNFEDSVAAMSNAIISMCDKFLNDLEHKESNQIIVKTSESTEVFTKINKDKIVYTSNKNAGNLGMFLHQIDAFAKKIIK